MSLRSDVLHSLKWLAGLRFSGQLVAWAVTLVVIRILDPSDYGLMAIAQVMIGFAALFREMGLYSAMVQVRELQARQVEQAFGLLLVGNCVIYVILFVSAPWFATFFGYAPLTNIVRVLGIEFPLAAFGVVQDAMLSRGMKFKRKSFVNLAVTFGNAFTTLGFALSGAGVWALVYGHLAGSVIRSVGLVVAARHWCWPRFSHKGMAGMLRFGSFMTANRVLWYVYSRADVFIIGKILGTHALGFYSIAMQLASMPMQKVGGLLNQVGLVAYSSVQTDLSVVRSHFLKVVRTLSFVSFPVFWGMSSVSPELVNVVLGQRWAAAIIPLQLLGLVMPLRMVAHGNSEALPAIGKPHLGTAYQLMAVLLMPPAFFIGAWYGGIVGAALAWIIAYPILMLVQLRITLRPLGLAYRDYFASMAGPATGAAIMYLVVAVVRWTVAGPLLAPVAGLVLLVVVGVLAYAAFMWFVRRVDCHEAIALARAK
ncbi:MAG TPA: lipopolysaccharide biosynthesis protein [Oleiagrimonas sp.]|nr:lipopolysaccharide biosynthesis protein [Oleiagrimonas sp.]